MLLLERGVLPLERLELRDLTSGTSRRWLGGPASQPSVLRVLPPLGQHEGMDLQCSRDGLHLNPRLLTKANSGEFELVGVLVQLPRS